MSADWQAVIAIATALGLVVAIGTLAWHVRVGIQEARLRRSEFALRETIWAWNEALNLLRDGNNRRDTWIAAARTIEIAKRIRAEITHQPHIEVLEVHEDNLRRAFGSVLGWDNPNITGGFFYGTWPEHVDLDEAARASTRREDGRPTVAGIPEAVLLSLWQFSQYPDDYEDPLPKARFNEKDVDSPFNATLWPGLIKYLQHIRRYRSVNGEIVERQQE